ncbi:MAG: 50S ribosomal protein L25 [Bacteroidales bacterium]|nr:50S ribosomal protein L25 [Bacteroidales bacterium]
MKKVSMSGSLRENVGKKDAMNLRRKGNVPCVLYGGKEQVHFIMDEKSLTKILNTPDVYIVNITIDGKEYDTIIQEVQNHPVTDRVLHIDFLQVLPEKPVIIAVPVITSGVPKGVLRGGKLIKKVRKVKIKGVVKDLPDFINIEVSGLDIGQSIKISDLKQENLLFLDSPNNVVVTIRSARTVVEETPAGEAAAEAGAADSEKKE